MSAQKTLTYTRPQAEDRTVVQATEGGSGNSLQEQAAAYAKVARDALDDCERGAEAEQELNRRRNRPGQ